MACYRVFIDRTLGVIQQYKQFYYKEMLILSYSTHMYEIALSLFWRGSHRKKLFTMGKTVWLMKNFAVESFCTLNILTRYLLSLMSSQISWSQ